MNNAENHLKCRRCPVCSGFGCIDQLPGFGGVFHNKNFQLNCSAWKELQKKAEKNGLIEKIKKIDFPSSVIMCAPVTGSQENIGYEREEDFYFPYLDASRRAGFGVCVGDGCPDEKLEYGIEAVKKIRRESDPDFKAIFILKPYPQEILLKRLEKILPYASHVGIDTDAYNIVTMRNKVHLEKKTASDLEKLRIFIEKESKREIPFVIKGLFTEEDLDLVRAFKPGAAIISNHGGRVETRQGSSADFLLSHADEVKKYCGEVWVDGGIRSRLDVQTALFYGADRVLIGRPFIRSVFDGENLPDFSC